MIFEQLLLVLVTSASFSASSETPDYLSDGIIFHKETKILLAEKFVNVEFLIPFPNYNFTQKDAITTLLQKLSNMWKLPSAFCPLAFSTGFNSSSEKFNLDWLVKKITEETDAAKTEVDLIRSETAQFLTPHEEQSRARRSSDGAGAASLLAGIGLGIVMQELGGCGITGIFGGCQKVGRKNAENIQRLSEFTSVLTDHVLEYTEKANEKFYLISSELKEIEKIQREMADTQNKNWRIVEEQFEVFEKNFHILRDCSQMLFSNQQLNFNFDTVASLLAVLYADIKSYRSALYAYKINVQNSIPILLCKRLPMSSVPRDSLTAILESVHDSQKHSTDRLSLAIPMKDLLSYYDAQLLTEVSSLEQGLLLTLSMPLASKQKAFDVYRSQLVPMPQPDPSEAIQWITEGPYLAVSQDTIETTVLSERQFSNCLGSAQYRIFHETMETHLGQSSCLATLYLSNTLPAVQVCDTEKVVLPTPEKATNLGYGIWLIASASDSFTLREYSVKDSTTPHNMEHKGNVCLITLECGLQLISRNIKT